MNNDNTIYIGSHVSMSAPDYYLGSVKEAISYGANTFMFYTGAPQNSMRIPLERLKINEGKQLLKENGFDESKIIVHAPYIINLANKANESLYEISKKCLKNEIARTAAFGPSILVLHPGSHVGNGEQFGLNSLIDALNEILDSDQTNVKIALETMAGKGSEIGRSFEQLNYIISNIKKHDRIGVCLDTCHISDGGYDVHNVDEILADFDKKIGLNKLLCIHINDSKNESGSHKDRHENLGYGFVGFDTINSFVHHPLLVNVPKVLETPYINGEPPYKKEIAMLRDSKFIENWRD